MEGGAGAQICPASLNAPEFRIKTQRHLSVWAYLHRWTFAVVPWTPGCDVSCEPPAPMCGQHLCAQQRCLSPHTHIPAPRARHIYSLCLGRAPMSPPLSALFCPFLLPSLTHASLHQSALVHLLIPFLLAPPGLLRYLLPCPALA